MPIILRLVDDCLDNVRPDHGRSAVGKTEQAKELPVHESIVAKGTDNKRSVDDVPCCRTQVD